MRKNLLMAGLIIFTFQSLAFSAYLDVNDRTASPSKPAKFQLSVRNTGNSAHNFQARVSPYSSWFYVGTPVNLQPGENHSFTLSAYPPEDAIQQNYFFTAYVSNDNGETKRIESYFTVVRKNDLLLRSINKRKSDFKPGETATLTVEVLNTASQRIENYSVKAEMVGETYSVTGLPIEPGSTSILRLNVKVPEGSSPGKKQVNVYIEREGEKRESVTRTVNVVRVKKIKRSQKTVNKVVSFTRQFKVQNEGNFPTKVSVNHTLPSYLEPITSFSKDPDQIKKKSDGTFYSWNFKLDPGENEKLEFTINYWVPLFIILILFTGLLLIKKIKTSLLFTKTVKEAEEGIKVHIEVENRSSNSVRNVKIKDFVPNIAAVKDNFPMAKPVIRETSNGTRLTWEIEELEPGDQRVFEYLIKPRFEVEGGVTLPAAELESDDVRIAEETETEAEFQPRDT